MKLSTLRKKIFDAIMLAERIVGKKESLPVLSCVLLEAKDDLVIRATNLEAGIEIRVPCEVEDGGVVTVPATILSQTIRSVSADKISLRVDEKNLLVESKGTKTLIKAIPHEEFPALPAGNEKKGITVPRDELMQAISSVVYAASPSMIRPELGSVFVSVSHDGITCVATDSFRLAEKRIAARQRGDAEILVPLKHAQELLYVLDRVDQETVEISFGESQMVLEAGDVRYISRLVDGQFPNYKEIIPKKYQTEVTLLKADFAEVLRKARVFSGTDQHVGFHMYPARKIFTVIARSNDVGEMSDTIDAALSGDDLDISFHIGYLSDCISSIVSDSITLQFAGAGRPLVIRGASDLSYMYLVMPLNR